MLSPSSLRTRETSLAISTGKVVMPGLHYYLGGRLHGNSENCDNGGEMPRLAILLLFTLGLGLLLSSCTTPYRKSIGVDNNQYLSRIFLTDFNVAWQSVLDGLKTSPL